MAPPPDSSLEITLPMLTLSEANVRHHWGAKASRARGQRSGIFVALRPLLRKARFTDPTKASPHGGVGVLAGPIVVTITRLSRGVLDDDNLRGALKAVRDGIADALGLRSDSDPRVTWEYAQGKAARTRSFGVRIEVRPRESVVERPRGGLDS